MVADPLDISALVVTYNHADEITDCVDAALEQVHERGDIEVVVVDNASADDTVATLESFGNRIRLVTRDENTGYADGVNTAFAASTGQLVLLLNPDVVMDASCVTELTRHLSERRQCGAAAAMLRNLDGSPQRFARRDVGIAEVFWNFTTAGRWLDRLLGGRRARRRVYEDEWSRGICAPLPVDCPAAACVLVRRELLEPQPLSSDLVLFFNDAELWRRLRSGGWSVEVVPTAGALHDGATSIRRADTVRIRAEWVVSVRRYLHPVLRPPGRAAVLAIFLSDVAVDLLVGSWHARRPALSADARGTLGGLGLPGGPPPWLTPVRKRLGRAPERN